MPFWSSLNRVAKITSNVPAYRGFSSEELNSMTS